MDGQIILDYAGAQVKTTWDKGRGIENGFLTIGILLILSPLLAFIVFRIPYRAGQLRQSAAFTEIACFRTALNTFQIDNDRYPTAQETLQALVTDPGGLPNWKQSLEKVPLDPWGRPYRYIPPSTNGSPFHVASAGPDGVFGNADDIQ